MIAVAAKIYKITFSLEDGPHMNGDTQTRSLAPVTLTLTDDLYTHT